MRMLQLPHEGPVDINYYSRKDNTLRIKMRSIFRAASKDWADPLQLCEQLHGTGLSDLESGSSQGHAPWACFDLLCPGH